MLKSARFVYWFDLPNDALGRRTDTLTLLDFLKITAKTQLAMYNGVLLSWREKVSHAPLAG